MPVADTIHEVSYQVSHLQLRDDDERIDLSQVPRVETCLSTLDRCLKLREEIEIYKKEEAEAKKSAERMEPALRDAEEVLVKAEEKKRVLVEKNQFLEKKLQDQEIRVEKAVTYWNNFGLDVKQISRPDDPCQEYEFTFRNLDRRSGKKVVSSTVAPAQESNNLTPTTTQRQNTCSIRLRYQDKKLEVVEQVPLVLSTDELSQLNDKITQHCVNHEKGTVNYKSAMTLVRQDLKRSLFPSPRTYPHPPAETNSHTCT